jgi:hypothetical protein
MTSRTWLLVPSYLLGPAVWSGVSDVLKGLQQFPVVPAPVPTCANDTDHIGPWLESVLASVPENKDLPVVVAGFGAVCPRMHLVADSLLDLGYDVEALILVNGRFPADGLTPIEADPTTAEMLDGLVRPNGYLPPWHRWWGSLVESMLPDAELREQIFSEARPVPRSLFDQPIPAPKLPGHVGLAYLQTGEFYAACAQTAKAEGWVVNRIDGEHLQVAVDPVLVACMMMTMAAQTVG